MAKTSLAGVVTVVEMITIITKIAKHLYVGTICLSRTPLAMTVILLRHHQLNITCLISIITTTVCIMIHHV